MNFSPKYVGLMTILSVTFIAIGGGVGYAIAALNNNNTVIQKKPSPNSPVELTNKDKFINNLLGQSSIKMSSFDASIDGLDEGKTLSIHSDDLALNLLNSSSQGSKNKVSGNITVSYGENIKESFGLYVSDDKATVNYDNKLYYLNTSSLTDILSVVTDKDFPLPTVNGSSFSLPSMDKIATWGQDALSNMEESQSADGKTLNYKLPLAPFGNVVLSADKETLTLTGIDTPDSLYLSANGKSLKIKAKAIAKQDLSSSMTEDIPDNLKDVTDLNGLDGVFKTVLNMSKSKKVDATINASISGKDYPLAKSLNLRVSGNFDTGDDPYIAQVESLDSDLIKGKALVTYENQRTYVSANDKIKGYIDNTTIEGIMDVFKNETNTNDVVNGLENITSSFNGSALDKLIKGDYSVYNQFLKSLSSSEDGRNIILTISTKALGLKEDSSFTLSLNLNEDKTALTSISIKGFPAQGNLLDVTIKIDNFDASNMVTIDKSQYGNYNGILPVFTKLNSIFKDKEASLSYALGISNTKMSNPVAIEGILAADASDYTDNNYDSMIPLAFTASTTVNGKKHVIEGRRFDEKAYVSYDNVFKQSTSKEEGLNIYKSVMDGINAYQGSDTSHNDLSEKTQKAFDILSSIISKTDGLNIDQITDIFAIDNSYVDGNSFGVSIDTSKLGLDFGNILLKANASDSLSINATGITMGSTTISLNLNTIEYIDPIQGDLGLGKFDSSKYIEVNQFHNFTNGLFDLVNGDKKYGLSLKASLTSSEEGAYTSHLIGKAFIDMEKKSYKGQLTYDMDKYDYDPSIDFSYNDESLVGTENEGKLFVAYSHKNTKLDEAGNYLPTDSGDTPLYIQMESAKLDEVMESVQNMDESNLLYTYYVRLNNGISSIPFQHILDSKDYTRFLDDFIRKISISDDKVSVDINPYYLGLAEDINSESVTVDAYYNSTKITSVGVTNAPIQGKLMNMSLDFLDYANDQQGLFDFTKIQSSSYIDFNSLPLMVNLGLNTTENRYFTMSGNLKLDMNVIGIPISSANTKIDTISVHVDPGDNDGNKAKVSGYIRLTSYQNTWTEYFIRPDREDTLIVRHFNDHIDMVLVTQEEMLKHIPYYVMGWGMNFDAKANAVFNSLGYAGVRTIGQVEQTMAQEATGEDTIKGGIANTGITPEKLVKNMRYDEGSKSFIMNADLGAINTGMSSISLGAIDIVVGHKSVDNKDQIDSLKITGDTVVNVSGVVKIGIALEAKREYSPVGFEDRYNGMMAQYLKLSGGVEDYYVIKSIAFKDGFYASLDVTSSKGKVYSTSQYGSDFPKEVVPDVVNGAKINL